MGAAGARAAAARSARLPAMSQLSLFAAKPAEQPPRPPDLNYIRKSLNRHLRTLRNAVIMPWSEPEARDQEKHFPELARYLPAPEAEEMIEEFTAELTRLRAAE